MREDNVRIRPATADDRQAIVDITLQVFRPVSIDAAIEAQFGRLRETDWRHRKRRDVETDLQDNLPGCFVAEEAGRVVGYVTTAVDAEAGVGSIHNLAVAAAQQGKKLGKALVTHALDYFEALGLEHSRIETTTTNEVGMRFYPSMGYREVARKIHYFMDLKDRKDR